MGGCGGVVVGKEVVSGMNGGGGLFARLADDIVKC